MEYKEIFRLKEMLEKAGILFEFEDDFLGWEIPSYQIIIYKGTKRLCDAIEHRFSYGNENDLLEIMGGLTKRESKCDSVLGYLTAEEVFKRFKYCYKHNTSIYKEMKE